MHGHTRGEIMSITIRDRTGTALVNVAATNAVDRWAIERSMQSESSQRRGYDQARAALRFAEAVDRVMLWVGFRLAQPAVPAM
jgi:hypothetical protein